MKHRTTQFPGAISKQLIHYLNVDPDNSTDTVLIHIGINGILNSISNVNRLPLNIKDMVKKSRNFGVKNISIYGLVYTKRIKNEILEDLHKKLVSVCKEIQEYFIDNINICGFNPFEEGLHLLGSGKRLLAQKFMFNFNNFLSVKHRPRLCP